MSQLYSHGPQRSRGCFAKGITPVLRMEISLLVMSKRCEVLQSFFSLKDVELHYGKCSIEVLGILAPATLL